MPDKPISVTPFGDLAQVATALIEKVSEGIGGAVRPWQIVRVGKAEAKVARIKADAQVTAEIKAETRRRRALRRFALEEENKQANMEQIIGGAIPLLGEKSTPQNVSNDWIANFFEKCRIISDEDMQRLWSKILAGEANSPGTFSRRTVNLLSDLDKSDAELFTRLCGFVWWMPEPVPLIINSHNQLYFDRGISFTSLSHLESLSLIRFDAVNQTYKVRVPSPFPVLYFGRCMTLTIPPPHTNLPIGEVQLDRAGAELIRVCSGSPVEGFVEFVADYWKHWSISLKSEP